MATQQFVTPLKELQEVWRPRHTMHFPIWETRKEVELPHALGFPKVFVNGQEFVLAKNGSTALKAGLYVESVITKITEDTITKKANVLADQVTVTVGTTTVTKDQFTGGYLLVTDNTDTDVEGHTFPIKGNDAGGGTANDTIIVRLATELPIELDTSTDIAIYTSPYNNLILGTGGESTTSGNSPRGIPHVEVEANYYFWLQTKRMGAAKIEGAITVDTEAQGLKAAADGKLSVVAAHTDITVATLAETAAVADEGWALVDMNF